MFAALADQLASPETPEVREHYERLLRLGLADSKVRELMATVLAIYMWHALRKDGYTYRDYVAELSILPEIDWNEGDDTDRNERT